MIDPQHRVVIEYCVPWDHLDEATRGAAEILEGWAPILIGLELKSGVKGVFRASLDGEVFYDKAVTGRKPQPGELGRLAEGLLGPRLQWRKVRTW